MPFYRILSEGERIMPGDEYLSKPKDQLWNTITADYLDGLEENYKLVPSEEENCSPIRRLIDMVRLNPDFKEHAELIKIGGDLWGVMWADGDSLMIVDESMKVTTSVKQSDVTYLAVSRPSGSLQ